MNDWALSQFGAPRIDPKTRICVKMIAWLSCWGARLIDSPRLCPSGSSSSSVTGVRGHTSHRLATEHCGVQHRPFAVWHGIPQWTDFCSRTLHLWGQNCLRSALQAWNLPSQKYFHPLLPGWGTGGSVSLCEDSPCLLCSSSFSRQAFPLSNVLVHLNLSCHLLLFGGSQHRGHPRKHETDREGELEKRRTMEGFDTATTAIVGNWRTLSPAQNLPETCVQLISELDLQGDKGKKPRRICIHSSPCLKLGWGGPLQGH